MAMQSPIISKLTPENGQQLTTTKQESEQEQQCGCSLTMDKPYKLIYQQTHHTSGALHQHTMTPTSELILVLRSVQNEYC